MRTRCTLFALACTALSLCAAAPPGCAQGGLTPQQATSIAANIALVAEDIRLIEKADPITPQHIQQLVTDLRYLVDSLPIDAEARANAQLILSNIQAWVEVGVAVATIWNGSHQDLRALLESLRAPPPSP